MRPRYWLRSSRDLTPQDSVLSVDKDLVNPRTYQWNLGIERALPAQLKLAVNYVASRGRALYGNQQYNYFDPNTGNRLNPDRGAIDARANSAASQYDSIQVDVTRQFAKGLFFRAAYTYGKNFDDGSEVFALFTGPTSYPANFAPGGRAQDWGPAAFDYRQYFTRFVCLVAGRLSRPESCSRPTAWGRHAEFHDFRRDPTAIGAAGHIQYRRSRHQRRWRRRKRSTSGRQSTRSAEHCRG